ncbi:MAG: hypothetical protein PUC44_07285 [Eubacteriales bacterium]|nr:hypothetical protein [Eubacteriales bacterium]
MKYMHTRLPDFYSKIEAAAKSRDPETEFEVSGLESFKTAKLASLRVGRVEDEITEVAADEEIKKIKVQVFPLNPETSHYVVIKGIRGDGSCKKAVIEYMYLSSPTVETALFDAEEIDDRTVGNRQNY